MHFAGEYAQMQRILRCDRDEFVIRQDIGLQPLEEAVLSDLTRGDVM
jgi:hypothetical protein